MHASLKNGMICHNKIMGEIWQEMAKGGRPPKAFSRAFEK
jgi:hypothetical protein